MQGTWDLFIFTQCGTCMHSYVHTLNGLDGSIRTLRQVSVSMSIHSQDSALPPFARGASMGNKRE